MKWNREYLRYNEIESIIDSTSIDQKEIIMINNPIGYYYSTNRWSLVIPNSIEEDFTKAIEFYNVQYLVLDKNLPDKFSDEHLTFIRRNFEIIGELNDGTKIYEKES